MIVLVALSVIILVALAYHSNGTMDFIKRYNLDKESWKNKWKKNPKYREGFTKEPELLPPVKHWYYFDKYQPEYEEKFPFSSTILVATTDAWHLSKFVMLTSFELAITLPIIYYAKPEWYYIVLILLIFKSIGGVFFNIKYESKL